MRPHPPSCRARRGRRRAGFTAIELVVSLLIALTLAGALLPTYLRGVYKARRTEALYGLRAIHDAQTLHYATEREYSDSFAALAFELDGGAPRPDGAYQGPIYTYTLSRWDLGGRPNGSFRATASADLDPDDATLDVVIVESALTVLD